MKTKPDGRKSIGEDGDVSSGDGNLVDLGLPDPKQHGSVTLLDPKPLGLEPTKEKMDLNPCNPDRHLFPIN